VPSHVDYVLWWAIYVLWWMVDDQIPPVLYPAIALFNREADFVGIE